MKDDRMKLVKTVAIPVVIVALLFLCLEIETLAAPGEDVSTQAPNGCIKEAASGKPVGAATDVGCAGVFVVAPSIVQVGEEFSVGLKILTEPYVVGALWTRDSALRTASTSIPTTATFMLWQTSFVRHVSKNHIKEK